MTLNIKNSIDSSIDYDEYKALVKRLVASNSASGSDKSALQIQQTKLNYSRIKRWDKSIILSAEAQTKIKNLNHPMTWLVILESWCVDLAHVLPVLNQIAELSDFINLRIVFLHENLELIKPFLVNDNEVTPKVLIIDSESNEIIGTYGPRPSIATAYVNRFLSRHGALTADFKEDLQHWYINDNGQNIINDITKIITEFESNVCQ